ncbi:MAG: hypothetical protein ABEI52_05405 [Halobacteriaceae archaeon]
MTDEDEQGGRISRFTAGTPRDWAVVLFIVCCGILIPVLIYLWPPTFVPYQDAYLGLAMLPGILLGLVAIWLAIGDAS